MRRALAITLLFLGSATAQAGGDKVHNLTAGNLKIDGAVADDDPKVKITHPEVNVTVNLPAKVYKVKLPAGKIQLDVMSTAIDPVLVIQASSGKQLAFDDDGGEGLNSRLDFASPKEDTYNIVVASLKGAGDFSLSVKSLGGVGGVGGAVAAGDMKIPGSVAATDQKLNITGAEVDMKLGLIRGSRTVQFPAKMHEVQLEGGKYKIDVVAVEKVDPIVIVQDSTGKQLAFDDDGGGFPNARLMLDAPKADTYKVYVGTIGGQGKYLLTIAKVGGGAVGGTPKAGKDSKFEGKVDSNDPKVALKVGGKELPLHTKKHAVNLEGGVKYQIDLVSKTDGFDPLLIVHDAAGAQLAFDDDGGGFPHSRMQFMPPKTGAYTLYAAALQGEGDYVLTVKGGGAGVPPKGKVLDVGKGLKLTGALSRETKNIIYQVKMEGGKNYLIEMNSPDQQKLDPYIEVRDAAGKKLAEDDDGAGDLNARLVFRAPADGTYQIVARSFGMGIGDYTLEVRQQE